MGFTATAAPSGRRPPSRATPHPIAFRSQSAALPSKHSPRRAPSDRLIYNEGPVGDSRDSRCGLRIGYLGVALAVGTACRELPERTAGTGRLEVRWEGSVSGDLSGPASAGWCELHRVLEIRTVQGDTGIALALYPGKALAPGAYTVVDPARAESIPPAAAVAARWPTKTQVQGFRGDSGRVDLQRSSTGHLSGTVTARARSVIDTQRIRLTGTFRDLAVRADSLGCQPPDTLPDDPEAADTGLH